MTESAQSLYLEQKCLKSLPVTIPSFNVLGISLKQNPHITSVDDVSSYILEKEKVSKWLSMK